MAAGGPSGRFSALLLEGLDHYRKGRMLEAVRAWEEAYLLEPTNLRAREFLRSALERIHAHMGPGGSARPASDLNGQAAAPPAPAHPWLPSPTPASETPADASTTQTFARPPLAETQTFSWPSAAADPQAVPRPPSPGETQTFARPPLPELPRRFPKVPPPPLDDLPDTAPAPVSEAKTVAHQTRPAAPPPPPLSSQNPWDDGPSVAIPQPEDPGDEASGAWSIHKEALPIEAVADDETEIWMRGARELLALNDFSGALELLGKILARKPGDKEVQAMHDTCEHNLTLMYESKIGTMDGRPRIAIPPDEIIWLNLDPRAGFVLAQIDSEVSFEDLYAICGLRRLDTARILCQLLEEGIVQVQGQDQAVAKRAMHRR